MFNQLLRIWQILTTWNAPKTTMQPISSPTKPVPAPVKISQATAQPAPKDLPPPVPVLMFDTPQNTRHSIRVLCDNAGLSLEHDVEIDGRYYMDKDILCAVIEAESHFYNYLPSGNPTKHINYTKKGILSSTDWGLCQINDYFHIGPNKDFPSVDYVMANPGKVVEWMIGMYAAGNINLWDAYNNDSYKKFLPQNA